MQQDSDAACLRCGHARGSYRYCQNCGHDQFAVEDLPQSAVHLSVASDDVASDEEVSTGGEVVETTASTEPETAESPPSTIPPLIPDDSQPDDSQTVPARIAAMVISGPPATAAGEALQLRATVTSPDDTGRSTKPASEPVVDQPPRGGRSRKPVLAGLAAAVLLIGVVGFQLLGDDSAPTSAAPETESSDSGPTDTDGTPEASADSSPDAEATDEPSPSIDAERATQVTCWSGETVAEVAACAAPAGLVGAHWLFPDTAQQKCLRQEPIDGRTAMWRCDFTLTNGAPVRAFYSQWPTSRLAVQHFRGTYGSPGTTTKDDAGRLGWGVSSSPTAPWWRTSTVYRAVPWSAHIEAGSPSQLRQALKLVKFRESASARGSAS
jgi:hypothetical protein